MHRPTYPGFQLARCAAALLLALVTASVSSLPEVEAAPVPADPQETRFAAYPCNTGTSKGMTYTYDDVHRWNTQIIAVSNLTSVPANVIKGIIWVESRGMLNARSPLTSSGYYFGLMQIGATSAVPESMKSVAWMCDNAYNQILAGATELINKSAAIKSNDWTKVAGAYFGYGTDVNGTTTNSYMQMFFTHAKAMSGTTPGAADWSAPATPTATPIPYLSYPKDATLTIDTARLNMRTGSSTSASIIRVLTRGQSVTVLEGPKKSGSTYWYRIRTSDGTIGWIAGNYTKGPSATPTATGTPTVTLTPGTTTPTATPSVTLTATPSATSNAGAVYRTTTRVNLRQTPSTSGTILTTLATGTTVSFLGESKQADGHLWQHVKTGTRTGWISVKYLALVSSPTPVATAAPNRTAISNPDDNAETFQPGATVEVRNGPLNYRNGPGTTASVLATLKSGIRAVVLAGPETIDGAAWYQLRIDGYPDGWAAGRYLDLISQAALPTMTPVPTEVPTETATIAVEPTMTASPTMALPTTTMEPIVETPTPEPPTATSPPDSDSDGIEDAIDACPGAVDTGLDTDGDGIDDGCDPTPYGDPTLPPAQPDDTETSGDLN